MNTQKVNGFVSEINKGIKGNYPFLKRDELIPMMKKKAKNMGCYFSPTTPTGASHLLKSVVPKPQIAQKIDFYW